MQQKKRPWLLLDESKRPFRVSITFLFKMILRFPKTALLVMAGLFLYPVPMIAAEPSSSTYKVLANQKVGLNLSTVNDLIKKGDEALLNDDLKKARENFDKAQVLSKQLHLLKFCLLIFFLYQNIF